MKAPITTRQWELLSVYLDGKLTDSQKAGVESQIATNPDLKKALNELRSLKRTLHSVPVKHLRRNLTLMAEQVQPVRSAALAALFPLCIHCCQRGNGCHAGH